VAGRLGGRCRCRACAATWCSRSSPGWTSGQGALFDSQCGYTAANRLALATIGQRPVFPRYGYPNDLLIRLARAELRVCDVPVRPVYGRDWRLRGIRIHRVVLPLTRLLGAAIGQRLMRALMRSRALAPRSLPPL
jgi:hypothetical protein